MSTHPFQAKTAFERAAGAGVVFMHMKDTDRGTNFTFRLTGRNTVHTIETAPVGRSRQSIEAAATQAGQWARVMADRAAA
jgi:hypothetical protein